ncbi:MAG: hypothetical protein ACHQ1D_00205 [Nitrososphaerales archaeon]
MTKGIVLLAFGKRGYGFAAYNLAVSIRAFNDTIPITLYHDEVALSQIEESKYSIFYDMIKIDQKIVYNNGVFDPGFAKVNLYDLYPYDLNLYLDVDAICLKDIAPLFEIMEAKVLDGSYFYTHIIDTHTIDKGRDFKSMQWAWADEIWKHFSLNKEDVFYATNSSYQIVRKCDEAKSFYDKIKENYANPIPIEKLRMKWGGGQPDELYMNAALCQLKIDAQMNTDVMFFGGDLNHTFTDIENKFYFLSLYGAGAANAATTRMKYREWADRLMISHFRKKNEAHLYKTQYIMADKHASNRKPPRMKQS